MGLLHGNLHLPKRRSDRPQQIINVRFEDPADASDAEAVGGGDFSEVNDVAPPLQAVVELAKIEFRVRRHKERRDDGALQPGRQKLAKAKLTHAVDQPAMVVAVALTTGLHAEFTPLQIEILKRHCDVIPGVPEVVEELRARGIKIASTTGFEMNMMQDLIPLARSGGYSPDLFVTPDLVGKGRPAPWMAFHAARQLDVYPMTTFVKVGDTAADIAEAHAAGMWAVSVICSGNEVGLSREELEGLPGGQREALLRRARSRLSVFGPHFIIDSVADLLPVIDEINARLARGEPP